MTMHTTDWKEFAGGKKRIRATYGMDEGFAKRNNQAPHITVTGEIETKTRGGGWREDSGGMIHPEISRHFPNLRPLLRWHLVAEPGVPMHYLANGQYWWEFVMGTSKFGEPSTDPVGAFKSTVLYGLLPGDKKLTFGRSPQLDGVAAPEDIRPWLKKRLPTLRRQFGAIVRKYDLGGAPKRKTAKKKPTVGSSRSSLRQSIRRDK